MMKIEIHTKIDPKLINNQILCISDNPGGLTDPLTIILLIRDNKRLIRLELPTQIYCAQF